jgi:oligoribonuclease NrnB/cAMP/cGMP phosphodiesterase (DHH superfamily)
MNSHHTVVIYHADCADGFGAAFALWNKLGSDGVMYLPLKYGQLTFSALEMDHGFLKNKVVYVVDFSFDKLTTQFIMSVASKFFWFDHHKSAFENWCGTVPEDGLYIEEEVDPSKRYYYIHLCIHKSGALLTWEQITDSYVPSIIYYIDDYDRWQFKLEGTKELQKALWSHTPWSFEQWVDFNIDELLKEGKTLIRAHEQQVQGIVDTASMECTITWYESTPDPDSNPADIPYKNLTLNREVGINGLAANCPRFLTSDVGHALATKSGTFGLCWHQRADSKIECSLRSNGDFDVSMIAKKFGGGGHKNAAGFTLGNMSQLQKWFWPNRRIV